MPDDAIAAHLQRAELVVPVVGGPAAAVGTAGAATVRPSRLLRDRFTRADRWALLVLVVVPVLVNVPWALAGRALISSDNLTQNYPLRVLAGQLLAHGRLPLWDPQIWSGTPLLAGWNAGALYPGTWLFAVLPGVAAFEVNMVSVGIVSGVGSHLFLRRQSCSPLASFLGAITFTYTGFMSGQSAHLGLVEGMAFAPVVLLAIDGIARARTLADSGHFVALLGVSCGLVVLAGDPRALSNIAVLAVILSLAFCWRAPGRSAHLLGGVLLGGLLAAAVAAVQWLPGLAYLHGTQRAARTLSYFAAGSLGWHDLVFLFVPFVIGGNGTFGMPTYPGPFSLIELTFGVGLLPLVAAVAFAVRALRPRSGQQTGVWLVTIVVSLVLSAGANLPTGHLLVHIPLFGGQRLQNRNAGIGDFALCVLVAFFVDAMRDRWHVADRRQLARRLLTIAPCVIAVGIVCTAWADPAGVEGFLASVPAHPTIPARMTPYLLAVIAIAVAVLLLLFRVNWRPGSRHRFAAAIVVADVALFTLMASYQSSPPALGADTPASSTFASQLKGGRGAILSPAQFALHGQPYLFEELGMDDLTILRRQLSVEGYGSAVPAGYEAATGTHEVLNLRLAGFLGQLYDELDLKVVAAVPAMLGKPIRPGRPIPLPAGPPVPAAATRYVSEPAGLVGSGQLPEAGPWRLGTQPIGFELPGPVEMSSVTLEFEATYGPLPSLATIALTLKDGGTVRLTGRPIGNLVTVAVPPAALRNGGGAVSLAVGATVPGSAVGGRPVLGAVATLLDSAGTSVSSAAQSRRPVDFVLDGPLQGVMSPVTWHDGGRIGPLVMFDNSAARGPAWLEAATASSPGAPRAPGSVTTLPVRSWQDPVDLVSTRTSLLLVRSEEFATGWSVELRPQHGETKPIELPVHEVGTLQGVVLPAGDWVVTWRYHPARVDLGLAAGAAGTVASVGLAGLGLRRRRRRLGVSR